MKSLVNFLQVILITGMVYPVYAMWNNEQLSKFCVELKPNMSKQQLLDLAYDKKVRLNLADVDKLKWHATASTPASFSNDACMIKGMGDRVASARMATQ